MDIKTLAREKHLQGKRLAAPLVGAPGVLLADTTIKLAQQNSSEHIKAVLANYEAFQPDLIFPLMDLSVEANALGCQVEFPVNDSATVTEFDFEWEHTEKLKAIDILEDGRLIAMLRTVEKMKKELPETCLRGAYISGPFTLAGLILGAERAVMATAMEEAELHALLAVCTEHISRYAKALVEAGAEAICFLEPTGVMLGSDYFAEFSAAYVEKICEALPQEIFKIYHVCGNSSHLIEKMAGAGVQALSLDSPATGLNLKEAAQQAGEDILIIGNLEPTGNLLSGTPEAVAEETKLLLQEMADMPNFILSSGCDLPLNTPPQNIKAMMTTNEKS
jgi:uroporphyrinogen decarboxylase